MTELSTTVSLPADFARRMLPVIRRIAFSLARRLPSHVCVDDLISAGCEGLAAALTRFDPARAEGFEQYAELRIRGAMLDDLRSADPLSRDQRKHARQIATATRALHARLGRAPSSEDVATELGISLETYWERVAAAATAVVGGSRSDDDTDVIADLRDTRQDPADDRVGRKEVARSVDQAIRALPGRTQRVLELHYGEGLTLREIGEMFGVTESRICQIQRDAVRRLRDACEDHTASASLAA
jgi:RNA polymerase sigma factor FliA